MYNEDFLVNTVPDWQVTKELRKQIVNFYVVFMFDFAFEAVHLVKLFGLVVTAAHEEVLGQANFPG